MKVRADVIRHNLTVGDTGDATSCRLRQVPMEAAMEHVPGSGLSSDGPPPPPPPPPIKG